MGLFANEDRHPAPVANHMVQFAPALRPVGWIRTGLASSEHHSHGTTVYHSARPINFALASEPIQQREVNEIPDAGVLPIAEASPAGHPAATPELTTSP